MIPTHYRETTYGFEYGAAKIERTMSDKGQVVISVRTPRQKLYLRVTKTGLIRVGPHVKV